MRKTIVAGNWKMNASKESVNSLIKDILSGMSDVSSDVIVCAPFPYLSQVEALISNSNLMLGAQNLNVNSKGAFTGEVSAEHDQGLWRSTCNCWTLREKKPLW